MTVQPGFLHSPYICGKLSSPIPFFLLPCYVVYFLYDAGHPYLNEAKFTRYKISTLKADNIVRVSRFSIL